MHIQSSQRNPSFVGSKLLDALDLATGTDRSGKPQEQDLRLRMRGLDLA